MGKFGKKVTISMNPLDYNICIIGESGIGKTTIAKEICEKLNADYIHGDIGREDGAAAIEGIISEKLEDWQKTEEVVDDIVENKDTDYPDLKAFIWDTLDELIVLAEAETIRIHNRKNPDKKVDTINACMGGFGKGQDYATQLMLDMMSKLRSVGVSNIIIGHVKRTDITDVVTQETYSKLTADTTQKYFNAIKNKQHFVALAYIDREIVKEKTGKKNIVTKQEITVNKAVSESRVISFRDDTYSVDSKSRFANIVDKIKFDADEFIKAMNDAIVNEKTKNGKTIEEAKDEQLEKDAEKERKESAFSKSEKKRKEEIDEEKNEELKSVIQKKVIDLPESDKGVFKELMKELGITNFKDVSETPTASLEKLVDFLKKN